MSESRGARLAKNEALFREVNERLETLNEGFAMITDTFEILCECALLECFDRIAMAPSAYEKMRADATLFAVRPGHEADGVEDIVSSHEGYYIVRKSSGEARKIADKTDPRP